MIPSAGTTLARMRQAFSGQDISLHNAADLRVWEQGPHSAERFLVRDYLD
jgi:hypothetical protein